MIDTCILGELLFRECPKVQKFIPRDMFENLEANYNSVKAIYAKLNEKAFLSRERFGSYKQYYSCLINQLNDRIEALVEGEKIGGY